MVWRGGRMNRKGMTGGRYSSCVRGIEIARYMTSRCGCNGITVEWLYEVVDVMKLISSTLE